jgi:hypothetical protein
MNTLDWVYTPWLLYKPLEFYYCILEFSLTDSLTTPLHDWWPKENSWCHRLATLRNDVWYKGKTTTTVIAMEMEYEDEMKLNLQDSIGLSLVTHRCHVMSIRLTLLWNSIHRRMIRLPLWYMKSAYRWCYNRMCPSTSCLKRSLDDTRCLLRG